MSILRKEKKRGYTTLSNDLLNSEAISFRAKGIACYLLSKPDDWVINIPNIARTSKEGVQSVRTAMQELATAGFLIRSREQGASGQLATVTIVADYPVFIGDGTPEERINGYATRDKKIDTTITDNTETDLPENDMSERARSLVNTDVPITTTKDSFSNEKAPPEPKPKPPTPRKPRTPKEPAAVKESVEPKELTEHQEMFGALCTLVGWGHDTLTKEQQGQVAQTLGILKKAEYTIESLREFYLHWKNHDWRGKKGDYPTLSQVRSEIGKTRPDIQNGNGLAPAPILFTVIQQEETLWEA